MDLLQREWGHSRDKEFWIWTNDKSKHTL